RVESDLMNSLLLQHTGFTEEWRFVRPTPPLTTSPSDDTETSSSFGNYTKTIFNMDVFSYLIIGISIPLTIWAICALYSQVQKDCAAPIYVINLFISDLIQLCCLVAYRIPVKELFLSVYFVYLYYFGLMTSVGFMVCVALERYLVVAWPLWYRFRRTIKSSVVVCVVVWIFSLVCLLNFIFVIRYEFTIPVLLLLPFPLLIFFMGGTLKALSASRIPVNEKRRIVGVLVLVLLIYTLLFMPRIIWLLSDKGAPLAKYVVSYLFLRLNPLADLFLYVFMRKGVIDKVLSSVCCCRMDSNADLTVNHDNVMTISSMQGKTESEEV
ncbi:G-protein coupled receptor 4, partial [Nibea albiflora]